MLPQSIYIFNTSLAGNILLGRPAWYMDNLLQKYQFTDWIQTFSKGLETMLGEGHRTLSGGEKKLVGLLRALYAEPDIILADEPFSAADPGTRDRILNCLNFFARKGGVLICTHDEDIIAQSAEVYVFSNGSLVQANTSDGCYKKSEEAARINGI